MPYCTKCGFKVGKTAKFCTKCGFNIAESDSITSEIEVSNSCPSCGKGDKLRYSQIYNSWACDHCGHYFGTSREFIPTEDRVLERQAISYGKRKIPLGIAIVIILILLVAIGVPVWIFVPSFALEIDPNPAYGGTYNGGGFYNRFTDASIAATPLECFEFTGWTGTGITNPSSASTTVYMGGQDHIVTANFERYCYPPYPGHSYWEYLDRSPSYLTLDNNEMATDPSWNKLKAFLQQDNTDQKIYDEESFNCVDFSLLLHDNSEAAGIKAAYVEVEFVNENVGHALNAFKTTDGALVFVDCTGLEDSSSKSNKDTIAYVEVGMDYGLISLDDVKGFSYGNFQSYWQNCDSYEEEYEEALDTYNERVKEYNALVNGCGGICTPWNYGYGPTDACACIILHTHESNLKQQRVNLEILFEKLCRVRWELGGVVKEVKIWW